MSTSPRLVPEDLLRPYLLDQRGAYLESEWDLLVSVVTFQELMTRARERALTPSEQASLDVATQRVVEEVSREVVRFGRGRSESVDLTDELVSDVLVHVMVESFQKKGRVALLPTGADDQHRIAPSKYARFRRKIYRHRLLSLRRSGRRRATSEDAYAEVQVRDTQQRPLRLPPEEALERRNPYLGLLAAAWYPQLGVRARDVVALYVDLLDRSGAPPPFQLADLEPGLLERFLGDLVTQVDGRLKPAPRTPADERFRVASTALAADLRSTGRPSESTLLAWFDVLSPRAGTFEDRRRALRDMVGDAARRVRESHRLTEIFQGGAPLRPLEDWSTFEAWTRSLLWGGEDSSRVLPGAMELARRLDLARTRHDSLEVARVAGCLVRTAPRGGWPSSSLPGAALGRARAWIDPADRRSALAQALERELAPAVEAEDLVDPDRCVQVVLGLDELSSAATWAGMPKVAEAAVAALRAAVEAGWGPALRLRRLAAFVLQVAPPDPEDPMSALWARLADPAPLPLHPALRGRLPAPSARLYLTQWGLFSAAEEGEDLVASHRLVHIGGATAWLDTGRAGSAWLRLELESGAPEVSLGGVPQRPDRRIEPGEAWRIRLNGEAVALSAPTGERFDLLPLPALPEEPAPGSPLA